VRWLLVPQPHGFEGLGAVAELVNPQDPAVAQRVDLIQPFCDSDAAAPTPAPETGDHEHVVAVADDFLNGWFGSFSQASIQRA
jgi:hypothetical protein